MVVLLPLALEDRGSNPDVSQLVPQAFQGQLLAEEPGGALWALSDVTQTKKGKKP